MSGSEGLVTVSPGAGQRPAPPAFGWCWHRCCCANARPWAWQGTLARVHPWRHLWHHPWLRSSSPGPLWDKILSDIPEQYP